MTTAVVEPIYSKTGAFSDDRTSYDRVDFNHGYFKQRQPGCLAVCSYFGAM